MTIPRTILFDFDGVLCRDRFYGGLVSESYPKVYDWIQINIFGSGNKIAKDWMRGKIGAREVNKLIADNTGMDYELLHGLFVESVGKMRLDEQIKAEALRMKNLGCKLCLVTDNMDVFSEITVKNHKLDELFDGIINSADYGYLKKEEDGRLFDIALAIIGENDIGNTLLIDDSADTVEVYKTKGGNAYQYRNFDEFKAASPWIGE